MVADVPLGGSNGVRHHCYPDRHAWLQACPFLLVLLWCAVGSAVWCCVAGRRRGLVVEMFSGDQGSAAIHQHWGGRRMSHAARLPRHSSQSGLGLRALGPRGSSGGAGASRTRWTLQRR